MRFKSTPYPFTKLSTIKSVKIKALGKLKIAWHAVLLKVHVTMTKNFHEKSSSVTSCVRFIQNDLKNLGAKTFFNRNKKNTVDEAQMHCVSVTN